MPEPIPQTPICRRCGKCCGWMGEIIEIIEETGPHEYQILITPTGERYTVSLDADKAELYFSGQKKRNDENPCPFLRESTPGYATCTVHTSRFIVCREYFCSPSQDRTQHGTG